MTLFETEYEKIYNLICESFQGKENFLLEDIESTESPNLKGLRIRDASGNFICEFFPEHLISKEYFGHVRYSSINNINDTINLKEIDTGSAKWVSSDGQNLVVNKILIEALVNKALEAD